MIPISLIFRAHFRAAALLVLLVAPLLLFGYYEEVHKLGGRDEAVRRYEEYLALGPDDPKVAEFVRGRLAALR